MAMNSAHTKGTKCHWEETAQFRAQTGLAGVRRGT